MVTSFHMIRRDIKTFVKTIPNHVTLVAATKYADIDDMKILLESGINNFGENRVDSFLYKYKNLKDQDIVWHFIGHLQRNKAKEVINKIDYLHSLDSLKLADIIEKEREKPLKAFIEVSINGEDNKNGVKLDDIDTFVESVLKYQKIELVGLMMMAVAHSDDLSLDNQFAKLRMLRDRLQDRFHIKLPYLSMGMSDDYIHAIKQSATHIRLGRILFR